MENNPKEQFNTPQMITGLAMIGGLGITVMVVAFSVGVIFPAVDSGAVGMGLLAGGFAVLGSIVAWFIITEPYKHFDDINEPEYHGHDDH